MGSYKDSERRCLRFSPQDHKAGTRHRSELRPFTVLPRSPGPGRLRPPTSRAIPAVLPTKALGPLGAVVPPWRPASKAREGSNRRENREVAAGLFAASRQVQVCEQRVPKEGQALGDEMASPCHCLLTQGVF